MGRLFVVQTSALEGLFWDATRKASWHGGSEGFQPEHSTQCVTSHSGGYTLHTNVTTSEPEYNIQPEHPTQCVTSHSGGYTPTWQHQNLSTTSNLSILRSALHHIQVGTHQRDNIKTWVQHPTWASYAVRYITFRWVHTNMTTSKPEYNIQPEHPPQCVTSHSGEYTPTWQHQNLSTTSNLSILRSALHHIQVGTHQRDNIKTWASYAVRYITFRWVHTNVTTSKPEYNIQPEHPTQCVTSHSGEYTPTWQHQNLNTTSNLSILRSALHHIQVSTHQRDNIKTWVQHPTWAFYAVHYITFRWVHTNVTTSKPEYNIQPEHPTQCVTSHSGEYTPTWQHQNLSTTSNLSILRSALHHIQVGTHQRDNIKTWVQHPTWAFYAVHYITFRWVHTNVTTSKPEYNIQPEHPTQCVTSHSGEYTPTWQHQNLSTTSNLSILRSALHHIQVGTHQRDNIKTWASYAVRYITFRWVHTNVTTSKPEYNIQPEHPTQCVTSHSGEYTPTWQHQNLNTTSNLSILRSALHHIQVSTHQRDNIKTWVQHPTWAFYAVHYITFRWVHTNVTTSKPEYNIQPEHPTQCVTSHSGEYTPTCQIWLPLPTARWLVGER